MSKKRSKLTFASVFAVLLMICMSLVVFNFMSAKAEDESVTVTIHGGDNGTVTVSGGEIVKDEVVSAEEISDSDRTLNKDTQIKIKIKKDEQLGLNAKADQGYLFRNYTENIAGGNNNTISMRAEDRFFYDELSNGMNIFVNFVSKIPEDEVKKGYNPNITVNYDDSLGDVYIFLDRQYADEDLCAKHGLLLEPGKPQEIPWSVYSGSSYKSSNMTLAAIPKTEITSTLDGSTKVSSQFENWSASVSDGLESDGASFTDKKPLPLSREIGMAVDMGFKYQVEGLWHTYPVGGSAQNGVEILQGALALHAPKGTWNTAMAFWDYKKTDNANALNKSSSDTKMAYCRYLMIKDNELTANFKEVAPIPNIHIKPTVDGEVQTGEEKTVNERETTITLPYGRENSLQVLIDKLENAEKQEYSITVKKGRNLGTGQFVEDNSTECTLLNEQYAFTVSDIEVNSEIIITPNYGDKFNVDTITIHVNLTPQNGLNDIISNDSEEVKIIEVDDEKEWYFDPQFNTENSKAFTSGLSYPTEGTTTDEVTQLHFQVSGSGVFTFEFYLDGLLWGNPYSFAVYSTEKVTTSNYKNLTTLAKSATQHDWASGTDEIKPCTPSESNDKVSITQKTDGWCVVNIHVNENEIDSTQATDIFIANVRLKLSNKNWVDTYCAHTVMSVRNVGFYQGSATVKWGVYGDDTYNSSGTITAKINDVVEQGTSKDNVSSGTKIEFVAKPNEGSKFYGWSDGKTLLSIEETFVYTVHGKKDENNSTSIYAVMAPKSTYGFRVNGKFYKVENLQTAFTDALESKNSSTNLVQEVFLVDDVTLTGDITIPNGVSLIVPYDMDGDYFNRGTDKDSTLQISWHNDTYKAPVYSLTYSSGTMTVEGNLIIGAVTSHPKQSYQGHTSGAYSKFINDSDVKISNGGMVDIYGLVTGKGGFTVEAGGQIAQPFLILDYSGGTNTSGLYVQQQTPFNRYAMVNIQCEKGVIVHYKGELLGHASLFAMNSIFTAAAPVISYKTDGEEEDVRGLITLTEGGSVQAIYKEEKCVQTTDNNLNTYSWNNTQWIGKTQLIFSGENNGGATANHMSLDVGIKISTKDVTAFAVPYNFEIILKKGRFSIDGNYKLMPGASLKVDKDAVLDLNADLYVYDGLIQSEMSGKYYPKADQLTKANYSTNANFIVNGTFNINGNSKFIGVVQTEDTNGTAKIAIGTSAVLSGAVVDGGLTDYDCNYATFNSSARVWDKAHSVLATLEKGKTYKSSIVRELATFDLPATEIQYCNGSADSHGQDDNHTLTVGNTETVSGLKGSWKVEHSGHDFTWDEEANLESQNAQEWKNSGANSPYRKGIKHQCSELGCEEYDEKTVVYAPKVEHGENTFEEFNFFTYDGTPWTEEDIKELLTKYYTKEDAKARNIRLLAANAQPDVDITVTGTGAQDGQMFRYGTYNVTITLNDDNYIWLINSDGQQNGGVYTFSNTFTFTLEVKAHTLTDDDLKYDSQVTYKGADFSLDDLKASVSIGGNKLPTSDYEITITGDKKNAGTLTLKFSPNEFVPQGQYLRVA